MRLYLFQAVSYVVVPAAIFTSVVSSRAIILKRNSPVPYIHSLDLSVSNSNFRFFFSLTLITWHLCTIRCVKPEFLHSAWHKIFTSYIQTVDLGATRKQRMTTNTLLAFGRCGQISYCRFSYYLFFLSSEFQLCVQNNRSR